MATINKGNKKYAGLSLKKALVIAVSLLSNHNPKTDPAITVTQN